MYLSPLFFNQTFYNMKKIFVLFFAITFSAVLFGQISVGFKAGMNMAGISGEGLDSFAVDRGNVIGLQGGAVLSFGFSDNFSLVTELLFLQKGYMESAKYEIAGISIDYKRTISFNSLELPILFRFSGGDDFKFYGNAGPYINYLLGGKIHVELNGGKAEDGKILFEKEPENYTGNDYYADDEVNRMDFGVYVGGGIAKKLGSGSLFLDVRYGIGFMDLNNTDKTFPNGAPKGYKAFTNKNLGVTIGYMIEF